MLLVLPAMAVLAFRVQPARAEIAKPVISDLSVSHVTVHGALLEAKFSSAEGQWVHAAFVLRYSRCAGCVGIRVLEFVGALGIATGAGQTIRAELTGLPAATRQSFDVSVTAQAPFRARSNVLAEASPPASPPRGPIIVENAGEASVLPEEPESPPQQEAPERVSVESDALSFVTLRSDPPREARRRRAFDDGVTEAVESIASHVSSDFQRAPRRDRFAYPILGTDREGRVIEYKLVSAQHVPLGELSLQDIYSRAPSARVHSVFVWEKLQDAAFSFLFEARRVGTSDWEIASVGCTCRTGAEQSGAIGEESPLTPDRFAPVLSYAQAVLRDLHSRVLPEPLSRSAEPQLWRVGGPP